MKQKHSRIKDLYYKITQTSIKNNHHNKKMVSKSYHITLLLSKM